MCLELQVLSLKVPDKINIKTVEDLQGRGLLWRSGSLSHVVIRGQEVEELNFFSGHKIWLRVWPGFLPLTPDIETPFSRLSQYFTFYEIFTLRPESGDLW